MGLKIYDYQGSLYQFDEGEEPAGATLAKGAMPENKARSPKNKGGRPPRQKAAPPTPEPQETAQDAHEELPGVEDATDPNASEA